MWKTRPIWPASAAQQADWPRLAEAQGSLRHDLSLKGASGEPAGRGLSRLVFHIGEGQDGHLAQQRAMLQDRGPLPPVQGNVGHGGQRRAALRLQLYDAGARARHLVG